MEGAKQHVGLGVDQRQRIVNHLALARTPGIDIEELPLDNGSECPVGVPHTQNEAHDGVLVLLRRSHDVELQDCREAPVGRDCLRSRGGAAGATGAGTLREHSLEKPAPWPCLSPPSAA